MAQEKGSYNKQDDVNEIKNYVIDSTIIGNFAFSINMKIESYEEFIEVIENFETTAEKVAECINQKWAIPLLLEVISIIYLQYDERYNARGLKRGLPYLWKNNRKDGLESKADTRKENDMQALIDFIDICNLLDSLYNYKMFMEIKSEFLSARIFHGILELNQQLGNVREKTKVMEERIANRYRTIEDNQMLYNEKSVDFFNGLNDVIQGAEPKNIKVFQGTLYEKIPSMTHKECSKFWIGLYIRYLLFVIIRMNAKNNHEPILFQDIALLTKEFVPLLAKYQDYIQTCIFNQYWREEWLDGIKKEAYHNNIVNRPILRISNQGLYATTIMTLVDSINYYVESQMMDYEDRDQTLTLPPKLREEIISTPFEVKVCDYFCNRGYRAGEVTKSGTWKSNKGLLILKNPNSTLYGQVDAMAYHSDLKMLIVVECKVLKDYSCGSVIRNVNGKLSLKDQEEFRKKLTVKAEWIVNSNLFNEIKINHVFRILLTDIPYPIFEEEKEIIQTDYRNLDKILEQLESSVERNSKIGGGQ